MPLPKGFKHSEETIRKMRDIKIGKVHSDETKMKISKSHKGKVFSEEHKRRIRENHADFSGENHPGWGKPHTDEQKKKQSESMKGKIPWNKGLKNCYSEDTCKKISAGNKGKIVSEEQKKKISVAKTGNKNHNWNPNKTDEERKDQRQYPEYREWRRAVYERDSYACQKCGDNNGGNLEAHHIEGYTRNKELRTTVSNGITFCVPCHNNFHHIYGYGNNTEDQYNEFLKENYK